MASEENRPVTPSSEEPEETVVQDAEHSAGEAAVQEAAAEIAEDTAELTEDTARNGGNHRGNGRSNRGSRRICRSRKRRRNRPRASKTRTTATGTVPAKKGLTKGGEIGIIVAAVVVVLAALAAGVFWFLSAHPELTTTKVETVYGDTAYLPRDSAFGPNELTDRDRYDISDTTADGLAMRTAVARDVDGDYYLTNGEIQVAYWMEFYQMMQNYGSYISMIGLDTTSRCTSRPRCWRATLGSSTSLPPS